jgi:N-carbamoyl-L-amino-acid hydrolase
MPRVDIVHKHSAAARRLYIRGHNGKVRFDPDCIAAVRNATTASGYSTRDIVSGAGHDAAYIARVAPAAMIFVPCRDGISHNEAEFSSREQCAKGAQVLLQAVLDFDRTLAERSGAEPRRAASRPA